MTPLATYQSPFHSLQKFTFEIQIWIPSSRCNVCIFAFLVTSF